MVPKVILLSILQLLLWFATLLFPTDHSLPILHLHPIFCSLFKEHIQYVNIASAGKLKIASDITYVCH